MRNLDSVLKSRDTMLPTKVHLVKAMVFPAMCGCDLDHKESERWKIDVFELWYRGRVLRVPWTAGSSNQSLLKDINPEYALKGLMLKLKLWYFGLLLRRNRPFENDPDAVEDWGQEEKGATEDEMVAWHHWLNGHEFEQTWEIVKYGDAWHATVHRVTDSRI